MSKTTITSIPIKEYICGNCNQLQNSKCELQGILKNEKDMACSQIFKYKAGVLTK